MENGSLIYVIVIEDWYTLLSMEAKHLSEEHLQQLHLSDKKSRGTMFPGCNKNGHFMTDYRGVAQLYTPKSYQGLMWHVLSKAEEASFHVSTQNCKGVFIAFVD